MQLTDKWSVLHQGLSSLNTFNGIHQTLAEKTGNYKWFSKVYILYKSYKIFEDMNPHGKVSVNKNSIENSHKRAKQQIIISVHLIYYSQTKKGNRTFLLNRPCRIYKDMGNQKWHLFKMCDTGKANRVIGLIYGK